MPFLRNNPQPVHVLPKFSKAFLVGLAAKHSDVDLEFKLDRNPFTYRLSQFWLDKYSIRLPKEYTRVFIYFPFFNRPMTYPSCCIFENDLVILRRTLSHLDQKENIFEKIYAYLQGLTISEHRLFDAFHVQGGLHLHSRFLDNNLLITKQQRTKTFAGAIFEEASNLTTHKIPLENSMEWGNGKPRITLRSFKRSSKDAVMSPGMLIDDLNSATSLGGKSPKNTLLMKQNNTTEISQKEIPDMKINASSKTSVFSGKTHPLRTLSNVKGKRKQHVNKRRPCNLRNAQQLQTSNTDEDMKHDFQDTQPIAYRGGTDSSSINRRVNYNKMKVKELKAKLRALGLKVGGRKTELMSRLKHHSDNPTSF